MSLIPTLTGQDGINDTIRLIQVHVLSLTARLGGMGIPIPAKESTKQYDDSVYILSPLINSVIQKSVESDVYINSIYDDVTTRRNQMKLQHQSLLNNTLSDLRESIIDVPFGCCW